MNKYIQHFIVIITLLFAAAGCKKDDAVKAKPESELVQGVIAGVNGPTSGTVNQKLTFNIIWQNPDGTSKFDHLQDSTVNNIKTIKVFTLTNVSDSVAVSKEPSTISYVFKASTPGDYYLKFYKPDNADKTAIIDTIHITK
jgi:hypothetical protein